MATSPVPYTDTDVEIEWYAFVLDDDETVEDPGGVIRVVTDRADEMRAEFFDYDTDEWCEMDSFLTRLYDPDEIDGTLIEITREQVEAIFKKDGKLDKLDKPAALIMD